MMSTVAEFVVIFINLYLFCVTQISAAKYPIDLPQCHAGESKCLQSVITRIINEHPNGHSGLAIPPLEPLHVNSIDIVQESNSPISIDLRFKDLDLIGISKAIITKVVGFDKIPETSKFELYAKLPKIALNGNYKIDGKVLVLPIQGEGKSELTLDNMNIIIKYKPKLVTKNGKKYIQTDKFMLDFTTTKLSMHFHNLFNGDKILGDNMNAFLNENWTEILAELKPAIQYAIEKILENLINRIFAKVPYDLLFLPS